MAMVSKDLLKQQVASLLTELDTLKGPAARRKLASDPFAELLDWSEIAIREAPATPGPTCDVAGAFLSDTDPPTLVIAQATSRGRRAFTALHELGHYLHAMSDDLGDVLMRQPDGGRALEEASCDAFAAELLIPDATAASHLISGVTVDGVQRLYAAGAASRSAVCVAASRHLPAPGHVMLLDQAGRVIIDAAAGQPRVRRGSEQLSVDLVALALRSPARRATGRLRFRYRDDILGQELYAQVGELAGQLVVVAVTDHAPWLAFSPTSTSDGPSARTWSCEHCPAEFEAWERPCPRCSSPKCPECGGCGCTVRQRMCTECFLVQGLAAFDGDSTICKQHQ